MGWYNARSRQMLVLVTSEAGGSIGRGRRKLELGFHQRLHPTRSRCRRVDVVDDGFHRAYRLKGKDGQLVIMCTSFEDNGLLHACMNQLRVEETQSTCAYEQYLRTCMLDQRTNSSEPSFVDGEDELVTVLDGGNAILPCRLTGDIGDLEITWMKQDPIQVVSNTRNPRFIVRREGNKTFDLHIASVGLPDEGVYICQLNTRIPTSRRVELRIGRPPTIGAINFEDIPMNLNYKIPSITINESQSFFVDCAITGFPPPLKQWISLVNNTEVPMNMQYLSANEAIRLVVDNASRDNSGLYVCRARNPYGEAERRIRLVVQYGPTLRRLEPLIYAGLTSYINIKCDAYASPLASYEWTKQSENGGKLVSIERSLVIVKLHESDYGFYTCTATNLLGTAVGSLEICGRPRQPTILSPRTSPRRHAYKLEWVANSITQFGTKLNIDEFIVQYRPLHIPKTLQYMGNQSRQEWYQAVVPFVSDSETTSHIIRDLFANTTYELLLYGQNSLGKGEGARLKFTTSDSDVSISDPVNDKRKAEDSNEREPTPGTWLSSSDSSAFGYSLPGLAVCIIASYLSYLASIG